MNEINAEILKHLKERPMAPIVDASNELENGKALKLMCIIDHILEINGLYQHFASMPKLMEQLLKFHSYGSFKYYKYKLTDFISGDKILHCKFCELIGPYKTILEHMVINHNWHPQSELCMWCEEVHLSTHKSERTLGVCYDFYLQNFSSKKFPNVVTMFYDLLENLAENLNVKVCRSLHFQNSLQAKKREYIEVNSDDISNEVFVFTPKTQSKKVFDENVLEKRFINAMVHFYGTEAQQRFSAPKANIASNQAQSNERKRRCSTSSVQANEEAEANASTSQSTTPANEIKFDPDNTGFFHRIASMVNNMQDGDLIKEAKMEIKEVAMKFTGQDLDATL